MVRILVVDDSTTMQKVVRIAFSKYKAQVIVVSSVAQALAQISSQPQPNLLIIDSVISGANSLTDLQRLKKELPIETKFLLLTSSHYHLDESKYKECSFEVFLKKPFESNELVSVVTSLLGHQLQLKSNDDAASSPLTVNLTMSESEGSTKLPPTPKVFGLDSSEDASKIAAFSKTVMIPPPPGGGSNSFDLFSQDFGLQGSHVEPRDGFTVTQEVKLPPPPVVSIPFNPTTSQVPQVSQAGEGKYSVNVSSLASHSSNLTNAQSFNSPDVHSQLKSLVEDYCKKHFADIAAEVITKELRKLADEKARSLLE